MYTIKDILQIEVAPAIGCTEPAAVALCTADADAGTAAEVVYLMGGTQEHIAGAIKNL